jgi:nucleoside-diphosphate-sugar epimerase
VKVVVTGAHGLTGGAVVDALAARGHHVRAVVRRTDRVPGANETMVTDVTDREVMGSALSGAEALVHVAGIQLGEALVRLPALRDIRRVVVVSSAGIYSSHRASAATYGRNERALAASREDVVIVRPTMIYGAPRDRNVHHVIRFAQRWRFLPIPGDGASLIQPIHYLDLAAALATLVDRGGTGTIDAGGAFPHSLRDAAIAIFAALDAPARLVHVPLAPARGAAAFIDCVRGSRWRERVERALEDRSVDNGRLIELTGVHPRTFPEGVRDQVRELRGR